MKTIKISALALAVSLIAGGAYADAGQLLADDGSGGSVATTITEQTITDIQGDIGTVEGRMDAAEGSITDHEARLAAAEGEVDAIDTRLTTAEGDIDAVESRMDAAEGSITDHGTRLTAAEDDIDTLDDRITTAEGDIGTVKARMGTAEGTIVDHGTRLTTAEDDIDAVEGRMDAAEGLLTGYGLGGTENIKEHIADLDSYKKLLEDSDTIGKANMSVQQNGDAYLRDVAVSGTLKVGGEDVATEKYVDDADTALGLRIDDVESDLSDEVTARTNADATLQANIDAEETRALAAEGVLDGKITQETTDRAAADTDLYNRIQNEQTDRIAADADLYHRFDTEQTDRVAADADLYNRIQNEQTDRIAIDTDLYNRIQNEQKDRITMDTGLQTQIDAEVARAKNAEGDLDFTGTHNAKTAANLTDAVKDLDSAVGDLGKLALREHDTEGTDHSAHHEGVTNVVDALIATEDKIDSLIRREGGSGSDSGIVHLGRNSVIIGENTGNIYWDGEDNNQQLAIKTISALDGQFWDVATMDQIYGLDNRMDNLTDELRTNLAAVNAMSALVPNARSVGDTQVSIGTGGYKDATAVAAGVFHYVNDGTLLNAGVSYGTGKQANVGWRAGVTFGF